MVFRHSGWHFAWGTYIHRSRAFFSERRRTIPHYTRLPCNSSWGWGRATAHLPERLRASTMSFLQTADCFCLLKGILECNDFRDDRVDNPTSLSKEFELEQEREATALSSWGLMHERSFPWLPASCTWLTTSRSGQNSYYHIPFLSCRIIWW